MLRWLALGLLISGQLWAAEEPPRYKLAAPAGWGGESIQLPPRFAPDLKLKGMEHIRFAPGMMKPDSDSFFSYAFVFELEAQPALTEAVVKEEFLTYYRGLCKAVLNGKRPEVDPREFKIAIAPEKSVDGLAKYTGTLDWIEPFATKKPQKLNLEIWTWSHDNRNYVFACVSPQDFDAPIWQSLRTIRADYLKP